MSARVAACVGWVALMAPAIALAQDGGDQASSNWAAVAACAGLPDATRRHQCVDGVLRRSGVLSEAQVAREASEEVTVEERAVARRTTAEPARQPVPVGTPRPAQIDELVTTISNVRSIGLDTFLVTAAEGSVWEQTDAESFLTEPKKGDIFTVERGLLGGYRCRFARSSLYPCRRVN